MESPSDQRPNGGVAPMEYQGMSHLDGLARASCTFVFEDTVKSDSLGLTSFPSLSHPSFFPGAAVPPHRKWRFWFLAAVHPSDRNGWCGLGDDQLSVACACWVY
eukprot:GGOE01026153.1.p1 GENE.GGOE01026153.1~~GGOE01026153.1.p1  ORF type:complete len:104 (-),score=5.45 GGOE01026153.1:51-362(-)